MKNIVVLTGAGVSAESGISTFRDAGGLWENHAVQDVASPEGWKRNRELVLRFYNERRKQLFDVKPNDAHEAIADLETKFRVHVITQNIDDLHERGGSTNVLHLHGEIFKMRSVADDETIYEIRGDINVGDLDEKGIQLGPFIVWFEEPVPMMEKAAPLLHNCDYFIVIGTSLQVYPAASLLHYAPTFLPKFIIDKKIPEIGNYINLTKIEMPATEGVRELRKLIVG
jgi:NAD-dependent deacetylase